jgi:hypothetical protein
LHQGKIRAQPENPCIIWNTTADQQVGVFKTPYIFEQLIQDTRPQLSRSP